VSPGLVGLVYHGMSGVGKSRAAEYFAGLVRARGGRALYRTASHYLSKWVGEGSATLRADFAVLEAAFRETGVRSLLVVDELEAIALDRGHAAALQAGHLDVLDTLLHLLTQTGVRMIGISNVADRYLETALTRGGRLRILPFPETLGAGEVAALVERCLDGVPLGGGDVP
jgi:ATP-dependent 26S proteasome regulatory subunit